MSVFLQPSFQYSDIMPQHEQRIVNTYHSNIDHSQGYNVCYSDRQFNAVISQRFWRVLHEWFHLGSDGEVGYTWAYVQTHAASSNYWHNHKNTSTINAVFYWNIPAQGGELDLCVPQGNDITVHSVQPILDTVIIFPYWLYHRPRPQVTNETRISMNIEYFSRTRPRLRHTGELW